MENSLKKELESQDVKGIRKMAARMNIAVSANRMIERYGLSQKVFCEALEIKEDEYEAFLKGTFEYTIDSATNLEYLSETLALQEKTRR